MHCDWLIEITEVHSIIVVQGDSHPGADLFPPSGCRYAIVYFAICEKPQAHFGDVSVDVIGDEPLRPRQS